MKFDTPVKQSQPFNRDYFHDNGCPICDFMGFLIFWKKDVVALTFVKFELSLLFVVGEQGLTKSLLGLIA